MAHRKLQQKTRSAFIALISIAATFALLARPLSVRAQSIEGSCTGIAGSPMSGGCEGSPYSSDLPGMDWPGSEREASAYFAESESALAEMPEPGGSGGNPEHYSVAPPAEWHQPPFSRIGIGADVSLLGVGLKSAIVLTRYFDARLMGNYFSYQTGRFEVEGFNVNANLHLASAAASLDWYPFNSIWRLSPGVMFFNDNRISGALDIVPGTGFSLNGENFYSANANPATGATPLKGNGVLGLHTNRPAATIAGGFGKFIPRSNRHWSFPSEFGVMFTGAPTINLNFSGWACLDAAQTQCGNLSKPANPVAVEFNNAEQATLAKWRRSLNKIQVYPIFTYSVVYSFNVRY